MNATRMRDLLLALAKDLRYGYAGPSASTLEANGITHKELCQVQEEAADVLEAAAEWPLRPCPGCARAVQGAREARGAVVSAGLLEEVRGGTEPSARRPVPVVLGLDEGRHRLGHPMTGGAHCLDGPG